MLNPFKYINIQNVIKARFHQSSCLSSIDVFNPRPKYKKLTYKERIKNIKDGPRHIKLLINEIKSLFDNQLEIFQRGQGRTEVLYDFKSENSLDSWVTKSDIDFDIGKSRCNLELSKNNTGLFFGYTDISLPNDGIIKYTGFCTMKTKPQLKAFNRIERYCIVNSTHLTIRFRGDGRTYFLIVYVPGYFDINIYDQYHYPLHTRGGPYWQTLVIPWTRMILSYKGRIQDNQELINDYSVEAFGITVADGKTGPFRFEVDYMALFSDRYHNEDFAYELYNVPAGMNY